MTREEAAQRVLDECFWGDYRFDVPELLARIDEHSDYFDTFLILRIVDNASYPSPLLRALFPDDRVLSVLAASSTNDGNRRSTDRRVLVAANISGNYAEAPVHQWVP